MSSDVLQTYSNPIQGRNGRRTGQILFFILVIAFGLRLFLVSYPEVIRNDGTEYIRTARQILSGDWRGGKAPPLYPLLIAFSHFFAPNDELAGIWVSVILGTLVVLPIFYLGKEIFNEKVGMISALFTAVHPFLYVASGSVLTESTYHFPLATSVFFGWKAFSQGKFYSILLFSLFTTFAYLTRPEAITFLFIFCLWVLWVNPPQGKRDWKRRARIIFSALFCFLVFASPYLIKIRLETGKWEITQKLSVSIGSYTEEEGVPSIDEIRRRREFPLISLLKDPLTALGKMGVGILLSIYKFQQGFHPLFFFLAMVGFIFLLRKDKGSHSIKGNLYLLSYLVFFFGVVFPFFWITRRYTSHMISLAIPWAAFGFLMSVEWIHLRLKWRISQAQLRIVLLILILIGLAIQGWVTHSRDFRFIQREAGLWMKGHLPGEVKIMSSMPQEAFYAERPWTHLPPGSYEEILKAARSRGARYLVIDEKIEKDSPHFLEELKREDLVQIKDFKRKNRSMVIFEIVYPKKDTP